MGIPLAKAELIALFVECILYGIFIVTFSICLYILVFQTKRGRVVLPMATTAVLLFICSTMHVSIDLARIISAFDTYRDAVGGPEAYLGSVSNVTHVLKSAVYITETCISDALVVYRCHVIVKQHAITIFLGLMVVTSAVSGYGSIYALVHCPPFKGSIFTSSIAPWITSFNVITAATNIFATTLIAYSIWRVGKAVSRFNEASPLSPAAVIVIESGAVYAFMLLLLTALYTQDSNAQFIVLDAISPLIGIVFCGVIIRVGLHPPSENREATWLWTTQGAIPMSATSIMGVAETSSTTPMPTKVHVDVQSSEEKTEELC